VGQALTFTAGVVVLAPVTGSPTGTVTFLDGSNTITGCSAQPLNAGAATCTAILTAGTHSITATYSGDAAFLTSTSLAFTQLVNRAATLVVLTSDNDPSLVGQSVTFTASLAVSAPGAGTPTGVLAFKDNGAILSGCAAQPISSGAATCTTSVLLASAQPRSITATYSGDTNFIGSVSLTFSQTVNKAPSSVSLNASQPGGAGAAVQFDVAVTVTGAIRSTGTVNITTQAAPATTIATCTLSVATGLCSANATVATGTTTFVARYLGDTNYIGSTGNSAALTVQSVHRAH